MPWLTSMVILSAVVPLLVTLTLVGAAGSPAGSQHAQKTLVQTPEFCMLMMNT